MITLPPLNCMGCRKCCLGDTVLLGPEDDPAQFQTDPDHPNQLAKRPDGNCVYLTETGCSIHGRQPFMCRSFDCRAYYIAKQRAGVVELDRRFPQRWSVLEEGRRRVEALRRSP